jgi:predicted permease
MLDVLVTIAPLFLLIAAGACLRLARLADDRWTTALNQYGLCAAFPALILQSLTTLPDATTVPLALIATNLLVLNVFLFGIHALARALGASPSLAASLAVCGTYGNIAYLGLPFLAAVLPGSEASAIYHAAVYLVVLFTSGIGLLETVRGGRVAPWALLTALTRNPLTLSIGIGLALAATGIRLPAPLAKGVSMLAASASPTVLISLGVFVGQGVGLDRDVWAAALLTAVKLVALPALFLLVYVAQGRDPAARVSVLQAAMPVGLTGFALAQRYPLEKRVIAYAVTLSTLLSALTLPLLTHWL